MFLDFTFWVVSFNKALASRRWECELRQCVSTEFFQLFQHNSAVSLVHFWNALWNDYESNENQADCSGSRTAAPPSERKPSVTEKEGGMRRQGRDVEIRVGWGDKCGLRTWADTQLRWKKSSTKHWLHHSSQHRHTTWPLHSASPGPLVSESHQTPTTLTKLKSISAGKQELPPELFWWLTGKRAIAHKVHFCCGQLKDTQKFSTSAIATAETWKTGSLPALQV